MSAVLGRGQDGNLVLKAGIMSIILAGGEVRQGDAIHVDLPARLRPRPTCCSPVRRSGSIGWLARTISSSP
jgi:hypothetical protein